MKKGILFVIAVLFISLLLYCFMQTKEKKLTKQEVEKAISNILKTNKESTRAEVIIGLESIRTGLEAYKMENETYPENLSLDSLKELSDFIDCSKVLTCFEGNRLLFYHGDEKTYKIKAKTKGPNPKIYICTPFGTREE